MKKNSYKFDIELLCDVMKNQSKSMDASAQDKFADWIANKLLDISDCLIQYDAYGNMYVTKGESNLYPCMVAHLDTVHEYVRNYVITQIGDFIIGFDADYGEQVGCGADDRVGISLAIEMFKKHDNIKLFFPVDEEVGGRGSNAADLRFFDDCCFLIQPDRNMYKNKRDYINFTNGIPVTTKEFDKAVRPYMKKHGYTVGSGTFTDIGELIWNGVDLCGFNLSCYLNAHTDQETVWLPLYDDAYHFVDDVITNLSYKQWVLPSFNYKKKKYSYFNDEPVEDVNYYDAAMEEVEFCKNYCDAKHVEIQLDDSLYCTKCQKTLAENLLIDKEMEYDIEKKYW